MDLPNEAAIHAFAQALAPRLRLGDCLRLVGTLGAGKTSFTRALVGAMSPAPVTVTSPTFTLLQNYPITLAGTPAEFWHADLYRLEEESALEELGLHELPARGVLCVEWPQIAEGWLPPEALTLTFSHTESGGREVQLSHTRGDWLARLDGLC